MKNLFEKETHTGTWIAAIAAISIAAGIITWAYLKRDEREPAQADQNYLSRVKNKAKKKSRTDIHELHHLVPGSHEA